MGLQTPTQILCVPLYLSILGKARVWWKMSPLRTIYSLPKDVCVWVWGFFLLYHGRDSCALASLQRERVGLGQLLHQAPGDGWVGGGPDAAVVAQCGLSSQPPQQQPPAPLSCFPNLLLRGSSIRGSAQSQSSVLQQFEHSGVQANPTTAFTYSPKIQRGYGPASTGEDLPNTRINPALLWALAQLNHHFTK